MIRLDLPSYLQDSGSQDCGPVCVRMVLEYFGIKKDMESIKSGLLYQKMGTSSYDNGSLLLAEGLQVTAITANPLLFPPNTIPKGVNRDYVQERIAARLTETPTDEKTLATLTAFLDRGGNLRVELPEFEHIKESIDAGSPVIALLFARALGSSEGRNHFVVVNGYDTDKVLITNPSPKAHREAWFSTRDFFHAVYASSLGDPDNATLLIASRP